MEQLTETIDLDIDESNDLTFKIRMEGAASAPAKVRLVCEGEDFSYMFNGYGTGEDEVVQFTLPKMDAKLKEGSYKARVEVLVENRYFAPLQFLINFKKTLSVVAEAVQVAPRASKPEIKVTATPVIPAKAPAPQSVIKFEQKPAVSAKQPSFEAPARAEKKSSGVFSSLREAYQKKSSRQVEDDELDESTVRQIARSLLSDKQRK